LGEAKPFKKVALPKRVLKPSVKKPSIISIARVLRSKKMRRDREEF